jgi:hypothetical protein
MCIRDRAGAGLRIFDVVVLTTDLRAPAPSPACW